MPDGFLRRRPDAGRELPLSHVPGTSLGPYQILAAIGAGGMGEVYRARDPRLGRVVAVKVLPASVSEDPDRIRRFEQEARAAGALNHPNVLAVYDTGIHNGTPYVVSELLEGETLATRMAGSLLPLRKCLDYAIQVARGLAAAHAKGIVHRDLKPDNLFVTDDGRVKILDFGLAKLSRPESGPLLSRDPTLTTPPKTTPGTVLGTVGYMAPEQVRGEVADHRADIFAFGAIFYEMLFGRRAFKGESSAETMFAILKHDPLEPPSTDRVLPSGVERILRHCLEKSPDERFQSARDLAFDLEAISPTSDAAAAAPPVGRPWTGSGLTRRLAAGAGAVGLVLFGLATGLLLRRRSEPPAIQQVTDRRGTTFAARFTPEGRGVVYSAAWEGRPVELFESRLGSVESRPLGFADATLLAVSPRGELAVLLKPRFPLTFSQVGTLARASLSGGAVRELAEGVYFADWHPTRDELAVVRGDGERSRLEFPIGKVVYRSPGTISRIRFSPRGDTIAFFEHSMGSVLAVVDLEGHRQELAGGWSISSGGLAWAPDGREIWFTAATGAELGNLELHAASRSGRLRTVTRIPGALRLHDISADGRVLVERSSFNNVLMYRGPGDSRERDLSWFRVSLLHDMTPDGRLLLFREDTMYLRRADGSPAVRLGEGFPFSEIYSLSPDGGWAFAGPLGSRGEPPLIPTSAGEARMLGPDAPRTLGPAAWLPGGRQLVVAADPQRPRLFLFDLDRGQSRALTPEGFSARFHERLLVSPDGARVAVPGPGGRFAIVPVGGGPIDMGPALSSAERPIAWGTDGRFFYTYQQGELPGRIYRIEIRSGERTAWRELMPADPSGVWRIHPVRMTPDGRAYAYTYSRTLGSLYVYTGLE